MFDIKLTGADSISKDYKAFNTKVYKATQAGLMAVGSEFTKQLQKHIQKDVYDAYEPKSYKRRVDYGGGIPLISTENMDLSIKPFQLTFSYEPSGRNSHYPDSDYVDGDELINRIENSLYDWDGTGSIPERHFWNNFVDEMVGASGSVERILVKGMNQSQPELQVKMDGKIEQDGQDTIFSQQLSIAASSPLELDADEELPF